MADSNAGPLDSLYRNNYVLGIILSLCCGIVGLVLSIICVVTAKDPVAKKNATICLIISIAAPVIFLVLYFLLMAIGIAGAGAAR